MKKECEETRKALPKYLHGHVFRAERSRIERHLGQCVICRSEFETLKRTEETQQLLRDINACGGVVGRVKDGVSALGQIKKLFYHPLWIAGIALVAAAVIYYLMTPRQLAVEIDSIVKTEPTSSTPAAMHLDAPIAPASASATTTTTTTGQPVPAASAAKPKTTPHLPAKKPSAPPRAQQPPTAPAEAAAPASPSQAPSQ
jgi:hypothetical protein